MHNEPGKLKWHFDNVQFLFYVTSHITGVFDVEQTRRILQAGRDIGLAINFHAEELNLLHGAEVRD